MGEAKEKVTLERLEIFVKAKIKPTFYLGLWLIRLGMFLIQEPISVKVKPKGGEKK